jgi:hypothetical protein
MFMRFRGGGIGHMYMRPIEPWLDRTGWGNSWPSLQHMEPESEQDPLSDDGDGSSTRDPSIPPENNRQDTAGGPSTAPHDSDDSGSSDSVDTGDSEEDVEGDPGQREDGGDEDEEGEDEVDGESAHSSEEGEDGSDGDVTESGEEDHYL